MESKSGNKRLGSETIHEFTCIRCNETFIPTKSISYFNALIADMECYLQLKKLLCPS
jgi:hypothetical protein